MEDEELLQRARRLCVAEERIQLPELVSGCVRYVVEREEREVAALSDPAEPENERKDGKLPLMETIKRKKTGNQGGEKERKMQERKRQLEKVKQAQERAKARIARTNHLEQQMTLRAAEQQQSDAVNAAQQCEEKIRRAQESRQRAKQRVRLKRGEKETPPEKKTPSAPGLRTESAKVKSFQRETIKRLQASTQPTISSDKDERENTPERREGADEDQKLLERKLRRETSVRLRRMKKMAENQKRQEQEDFEQGLQKFKSKLRELDRAAKGLSKQPLLPSLSQLSNPPFEMETLIPTPQPSTCAPCSSPTNSKSTWNQNQDAESSSDSDDSFNARNCFSRPDRAEPSSPHTAEASTRSNRNRTNLPAWKQPPVPIHWLTNAS